MGKCSGIGVDCIEGFPGESLFLCEEVVFVDFGGVEVGIGVEEGGDA